uniref:Uncharacterized protein n=1 Tax=Micrurus lemniscatus lemniscatus TaxID=129467 RepID=A0A2D4IKZ7_MICLE
MYCICVTLPFCIGDKYTIKHSDITDCTLDSNSSGLLHNHQKHIGFFNIVQKSTPPVLASYLQFTPVCCTNQWPFTPKAYKLITGQKIYIILTQKVSCVKSCNK